MYLQPNRVLSKPLEKLTCKQEHILPKNTTCYQLEDGAFFLFKSEAPYELSAVVNEQKVEAKLPAIKEPLTCAGVYGKALYFYSTPPRRLTYKFYRATIDEHSRTVQFEKINEIRTEGTSLHFARQQPFYVRDNCRDRLLDFEDDVSRSSRAGWSTTYISESTVFFKHMDYMFLVSEGDLSVNIERLQQLKAVEIGVRDPARIAILSCPKSNMLYLISENNFLVFYNNKLVNRLELQRVPSKQRLSATYLGIIGVHSGAIFLHAYQGSEDKLWTASFNYDYVSDGRAIFDIAGSPNANRKDKSILRANLSVLLEQQLSLAAAVIDDVSSPIDVASNKKVPTSTGKIVLNTPEAKKLQPPTTVSKDDDTLRSHPPLKALLDAAEFTLLYEANKKPTYESEFRAKYEPIRVLGKGTFGCVFEARFKLLGTRYAVKRIAINGDGEPKALNEVLALEAFNHAGIVRYNDAWIERPPNGWQKSQDEQLFQQDEQRFAHLLHKGKVQYDDDCAFLYIKMELCDSTLSSWLNENKDRDLGRMKSWFRQLVSAVGYIHDEKKIHRDLKPSNILFAGDDRLKICDFGIITDRLLEESRENPQTRTSLQGSPMYMAPEQFWSGYTSKVDIFALGLILAQLCVPMTMEQARELFDKYRAGKTNKALDNLPEVKQMVALLTNVRDADKRPTCAEILRHPFLA